MFLIFNSQTRPTQEPASKAIKEFPACGGQLGVPRHLEHPAFLLLPDILSSGPGQEQERKGKIQVPYRLWSRLCRPTSRRK